MMALIATATTRVGQITRMPHTCVSSTYTCCLHGKKWQLAECAGQLPNRIPWEGHLDRDLPSKVYIKGSLITCVKVDPLGESSEDKQSFKCHIESLQVEIKTNPDKSAIAALMKTVYAYMRELEEESKHISNTLVQHPHLQDLNQVHKHNCCAQHAHKYVCHVHAGAFHCELHSSALKWRGCLEQIKKESLLKWHQASMARTIKTLPPWETCMNSGTKI